MQTVQVTYKDGTHGTAFRSLVLTMKESVEAADKAGFKELVRPAERTTWPSQAFDAVMRIDPEQKLMHDTGEARIVVKDYREMVNPSNGDLLVMTDFDLVEGRRFGNVFKDPAYYILEKKAGTTSKIVLEIMADAVKEKFVRVAASEGVTSRRANRCIAEYAQFSGKTLHAATIECMKLKKKVDRFIEENEEEKFAKLVIRKTLKNEQS